MCEILEWYGEGHPVRARYENAMARWPTALQFPGMPFDTNACEAIVRNYVIRLRHVFRQFKSVEAMEYKSTWSTFVSSARLNGLSPGKATTSVQRDMDRDMFDPDRAPPARPSGGSGHCRHAYPAGGGAVAPAPAAAAAPAAIQRIGRLRPRQDSPVDGCADRQR